MEDKINMVIGKIVHEIKEDIDIYYKDGIMDMITLDNILGEYCENSMFNGGLGDIFDSYNPEEGEVGSYAYYVSEDRINGMLNESIDYNSIDYDNVYEVLVEYRLINKNNCEVSEDDYYDYSKWIIKVVYVGLL